MSAANALSSNTAPSPATDGRASEPSMEDILASIRRIIADDQSRHANAGGVTPPRRPPTARIDPPAPPVAAARRPPSPIEPPRMADRPPRPMARPSGASGEAAGLPPSAPLPHLNPPPLPTLPVEIDFDRSVIDEIASAGVAAALRPQGGPAKVDSVVSQAPATAPPPPASSAPASIIEMPGPAAIGMAPPVGAPPVEAPPVAAPQRDDILTLDASAIVFPRVGQQAPPPTSASSSPPPRREANEPLLSEATGASIESSFNTLATSILMQNTDMVETTVRDMLKPMLRTWLESNLPGIVERLVKSEIERVARGGRG